MDGETDNKDIDECKNNNKKIANLIHLLEKAIEFGEKKDNNHFALHGHIVWKEEIKHNKGGANESKKENDAPDGKGVQGEDFEFHSTEFSFDEDLKLSTASLIKSKLEEYCKKEDIEEAVFNVNTRLPSDSYGCQENWNYPLLKNYLNTLASESTSKDKKGLFTKDRKGNPVIKEGTSFALRLVVQIDEKIEEIIFVKLINFKNAYSKSKKRLLIDIEKLSKAQNLGKFVVLEPDSFDCAIYGNMLFVFHISRFFYLFVPIEVVRNVVGSRLNEMEISIVNPKILYSHAKNPFKMRDLFYFISQGCEIPDREEIEKNIKFMRDSGVKGDLFDLTEDNKIICTEENANLVLSYIAKKLGLRIFDKRLGNVEAFREL